MIGINRKTGKPLAGIEHLKQSVVDILTTPIGTRVMRRDYGSNLFKLIDAPVNSSTIVAIYAATAEALDKWEPRFKLTRVQLASTTDGKVDLLLTGNYLPNGEQIRLDGIVL